MRTSGLAVRVCACSLLVGIPAALSGCSAMPPSQQSCTVEFPLKVSPTTGTADHAVAPPGNQVQFVGGAVATAPPGCAVPALARAEWAAWQNPDPTDVEISSAADSTNGLAVCKGTTEGAVTLTGTFSPEAIGQSPGSGADTQTATVTLVCK